ncbi:MAG TPA: fatty acyl-AMP ligase [Thermoleophilaceae bacterium]|jgi:acyl-CoA synthetase (AMP-forming)/AMP-acid ligase II
MATSAQAGAAVAQPHGETLDGLLRRRSREDPDRTAYVFLRPDGSEESLTFGALHERAESLAGALAAAGAADRRVLLALPSCLDYVAGFFACVMAGALPVSTYPPERLRAAASLRQLERLADVLGAEMALGDAGTIALAGSDSAAASVRDLRWIDVDDPGEGTGSAPEPADDPERPAYVQATSGSTGSMKGVVLSHRSLIANGELQRRLFPTSPDTRLVSWLVLGHDMGFVAPVVQPVYVGSQTIFMTPMSFVRRPVLWLEAITRHRGTLAGAPNFAYELILSRVTYEQRSGLDLSSWTCAVNAAEPIRPDTLERFTRAFAPVGFRPDAFAPTYGLAEMTSAVTVSTAPDRPVIRSFDRSLLERGEVSPVGPETEGARRLVGNGAAPDDHSVAVVDPESGEPSPGGRVGEVWVGGPSAGLGYADDEDDETFSARLPDGEGPFVRTGDLGFVLEGELFVAGRIKDVIVINGRTHAPHEIEATAAACDDGLVDGGTAAFSLVDGDEERLAVVQEVQSPRAVDAEAAIQAIREAVASGHGVSPSAVVLVEPGGVPRTTSGKIRRAHTREALRDGALGRQVASWQAEEGG